MLRPFFYVKYNTIPFFFLFLVLFSSTAGAKGTYLEPAEFVSQTFQGSPPEPGTIWVTKEVKERIKKIMDHNYHSLRIRYWYKDGRSAWILEEIGKERLITTGLVVNKDSLESIRVLIYRETRGWEVRHTFFTDQFIGAKLKAKDKLDRKIDGITGATLSVRALTKLARMALYLHQLVDK